MNDSTGTEKILTFPHPSTAASAASPDRNPTSHTVMKVSINNWLTKAVYNFNYAVPWKGTLTLAGWVKIFTTDILKKKFLPVFFPENRI